MRSKPAPSCFATRKSRPKVAYVEGDPLGIEQTNSHAFRITPVAVVAKKTPAGFKQVTPAVFFTPVKVREYAV